MDTPEKLRRSLVIEQWLKRERRLVAGFAEGFAQSIQLNTL
jgi:hypothetical protein